MPRAVSRFEDTQRPLESLTRGRVRALAQLGSRQCVKVLRSHVMARAEVPLGDGQGPLLQSKGPPRIAEILQRCRKKSDRQGDDGVIGAQSAPGNLNGPLGRLFRLDQMALEPKLL